MSIAVYLVGYVAGLIYSTAASAVSGIKPHIQHIAVDVAAEMAQSVFIDSVEKHRGY